MMRLPSLALLLLVIPALGLAACGGNDVPDPEALDEEAVPSVATADSTVMPAPPNEAAALAYEQIIEFARANDLAEEPYPLVIQAVAEELVGRPYAEGLLDKTGEEALVTDLTAFDCVTYVENVLGVAQTVKSEDYGYDTYARTIQDLRYRGGEMNGYCSRLHYFTDWIHNNAERGNVENVTEALGGVPFDKELNFMGTHRDSYARLADEDTYQCILEVEEALRDRDLYYIPQDRIDAIEDDLRAGDIIATATDIDGLDVTHTGFVYKHDDGRTGLIHASLSGEVKVSPDLSDYVRGVERQIGIIVARPLERDLQTLPDGASGRVPGTAAADGTE